MSLIIKAVSAQTDALRSSILVVDDHEDLRQYITSILGGICRTVIGVADGEAALRILRTNVSTSGARLDMRVSWD